MNRPKPIYRFGPWIAPRHDGDTGVRLGDTPASFKAWVATLLVLLLSGCGFHPERTATVTVTLTSSSDLTMVAAGATVTFEAAGLASPQGVVILEPATAGAGPTLQVTPTSVTALDKLRIQITFQVPNNLNLSGPTPYLMSFSGTSASGAGFASSNKLALTLVPGARITSVSRLTGRPGDNSTINITGQYTSFAQGSTQAGLGAGISVGGGSEGGFGAVSVSSPNQLTAQIHISSSATLGARDITVKTGSEQVTLANGFTVVVNRVPVAAAGGPYSGTVGIAVQFNGTGSSDPDADPIGLSWDFGDGSSGAGATPVHTYTSAGTFTVKLTVADDHGGSTTATTTATISAAPPPNHPPTALPGGPYNGVVGQSVAFDGSQSTDPDNDPLTYTWSFGDGGAGNGAKPAHTYTSASTFTVTLTVTDNHGGSTTATTTAIISSVPPTNHPPTAVPGGPYNGVVGQPVAFDGSKSTDPDNDPLTYTWSFGDGGAGNGAKPAHTYTAAGIVTASLTVDDGRGGTDTATTTTTITVATQSNVPAVSITSPVPLALFNQSPITVTGMADATVTTLAVNGITATLANGSFTAQGVSLREGSNILTATALDSAGNVGTASVTVVLDTTPPAVHIDAPSDGAVLNTQQVTVTGMVNDIVTGTVNSAQASVVVNGVTATISNRSFVANGVLLQPGRNTLNAVARDRAGNESRTQIQVTLQDASVRQRIVILSGDNQTGMIGTVLQQPLAVQAVDSDGAPLANRQLTFTVRRSDGILQSFPDKGQQLRLVTDQQGKASVLFQLGTRVGAGINQAAVTAPGFVGEVIFAASTAAGAPTQIVAASGENQRGIVGTPLPHPFSAAVFDSGGNPLEGVPVKFDVQAGGGSVDGAPTVTKNTDSDGIANAVLTLGMQEGINNQVVTASCNACGTPASFAASAVVAGLAAETQVSGVVLDNADQPVPNATASIVGTQLSAISDAQGRFTIKPAPVGTITLLVDGRASSRPETFPFLAFQIVTLSGQDNTIGGPIYLPPLDLQSAKVVGGDQEVVLTMKDMPGVAFTVFPHSATFPDGSKVGKLMLTQVHSDKVPMPPPNGTTPRVVWTLQPAGVQFNPPIRIQLPNLGGLSPGQVVEAFQFDHDLEQWASVGMTRVSPDGSVTTSDPGFGISKAGWGHVPPPPAPTTTACGCGDTGNICGPNICIGGKCVLVPAAGAACDDKDACTINDRCDSNGGCHGKLVTITNVFGYALDSTGNRVGKLLVNAPPPSFAGTVNFQALIDSTCPNPQFEWDFGDGTKGSGKNTTHVYQNVLLATYPVTVTAKCGSCTTVSKQDPIPVQVSIFSMQIKTNKDSYAISGDNPPRMPGDVQAMIEIRGITPDPTANTDFQWFAQTKSLGTECAHGPNREIDSSLVQQTLHGAATFNPVFTDVRGGHLAITALATIGGQFVRADLDQGKNVLVLGTNPDHALVRSDLNNDVLSRIACLESHQQQFLPTSLQCPKWSGDGLGGVGIMQLTFPQPTADQVWDWNQNVQGGIALFNDKIGVPTDYVRTVQNIFRTANTGSTLNNQQLFALQLQRNYNQYRRTNLPAIQLTTANFTTRGATGPDFNAIDLNLYNTSPNSGQVEFDAIRAYNGFGPVLGQFGLNLHEFQLAIDTEMHNNQAVQIPRVTNVVEPTPGHLGTGQIIWDHVDPLTRMGAVSANGACAVTTDSCPHCGDPCYVGHVMAKDPSCP